MPPPIDGEAEVDIEGLGEADFPEALHVPFQIQHELFTLLYALLAARILVQLLVTEGLATVLTLNRHWVALFVLFGCVLRVFYIFTTDLHSALSPGRYAEYALRAVNDSFWFAAFAHLAFFWAEVRSTLTSTRTMPPPSANSRPLL